MAALVDFETAKTHLRVTDTDHDAEIQQKLDHASGIIVDRLMKSTHWAPIVAAWTVADAPLPVQAAILDMLGALYEHRGDDVALIPSGGAAPFDEAVWDGIERKIKRFTDPALA